MSKCDKNWPTYGEFNPKDLLYLAKLNESNVVITGVPGSGKTTLIKTALKNLPEDFAVVVFDTARDFVDVCHEYGMFSIDTTKVDPLIAVDLIEEALEAVYGSHSLVWTPAMAELAIRTLQAKVPLAKLPDAVKKFAEPQEWSTAMSIVRRSRYFKYPYFDGSAPRLEPKPGVITCVDLYKRNPITRMAYVLFALQILDEHRNIFYVIDEAHRLMSTRRALITEYMRVSRHNMQFFILITQSIRDLKDNEGYVKIFIEFPARGDESDEPHWKSYRTALMTVYVTNPDVEEILPGHGVLQRYTIKITPPAKKELPI